MRATDLGRTGTESREALDADTELKARVEAIRLKAGPMMNLGDVKEKSVPKMILVAPPRAGGVICHALLHPAPRARRRSACSRRSAWPPPACCPRARRTAWRDLPAGRTKLMLVEHPTGASPVSITVDERDGKTQVREAALVSTARQLFAGHVFVPESAWTI